MQLRDVDILEAEAIDEQFKEEVKYMLAVLKDGLMMEEPVEELLQRYAKGRVLLHQARRLAIEQINSPAT